MSTALPTVLFVNHVGRVSGAEQSLLTLLRGLDPTRYHARLACPPGELAAAAGALGVEAVPFAFGRVRRQGPIAPWLAAGRLVSAAVRLAPLARAADLLHANSAAAALACLPFAGSRPLVWHVRDLRLPRGLVRLVAPHLATAIAISEAVADRLRREGLPAGRLTVLPNALDPALFQPTRGRAAVRAELGLPADAEVVIAVGQLVPWKGQDLLLDALAPLAARRPALRLVLVGDDLFGEHPDYRAALARRAADGDLAGRVTFTGYRRDVADLVAAADVLALPSYGEPFGRVLLEAMAVGVPAVATVPGGAREVLVPGRTGLLVPQGDAPALGQALEALLAEPARRAAMGAAGRERVAETFAPELHARRVMGLYDRLLGEVGHGRRA